MDGMFGGEWGKGGGTRSVGHPVFAAADGEENSRTNAMCPSPRKKNTCQATAQHKRPKVPGLQHFRNIRTDIIATLYSIDISAV